MASSNQNNPPSSPNNPPQNTQQRGKGRQKTGNERIMNETKRQVAFSKRRSGLFKKAYEVGTLCAVETAVVTDSPSGKLHSFGNPNVEAIARRYLGLTDGPPNVHHPQILAGLNEELMNLESQLAWEKNHKKESLKMMEMEDQNGVPPNLDELSYEQLAELLNKALSFKHEFETKQQNGILQGSNLDAAAGGSDYGAQMVPGGYSDYPNQFGNIGSSSNDYNATFFADNNTNPGFDYSFNPMDSYLGLPSEYPPISDSGSNFMYPFDYGNPSDVGEMGGASGEAEIGRQSNRNGRGRGRRGGRRLN